MVSIPKLPKSPPRPLRGGLYLILSQRIFGTFAQSGPEFRHRVEGIVEAFSNLREELELEKRSTQLRWAKREKQLERAVAQTAGMYGDLNGIIGASLPAIQSLTPTTLTGPDAIAETLVVQ